MQWLNENDEVSMEFLRGAYDRDKKDGVSCSNEGKSKYSCLLFRNYIQGECSQNPEVDLPVQLHIMATSIQLPPALSGQFHSHPFIFSLY